MEGLRHLCDVAESAYQAIRQAVNEESNDFPELNDYDDGICLKNSQGVVVYTNAAYRRILSPKASPLGRTSSTYLDPVVAHRAEVIEGLIFDGCPYVECEQSGPGPDGAIYRMTMHERSLQALDAPGLAILDVIRLLSREENNGDNATTQDLATSCARFRELSDRDQQICRLTALGVSSRELGDQIGMTTRGIELRKQKAFAHLGVGKAVDLARLLVRLQDRGYLDLGL